MVEKVLVDKSDLVIIADKVRENNGTSDRISFDSLITSTIECLETPNSSGEEIEFYIEGIAYKAISGMTWGEWFYSNYNTLGYKIAIYSYTSFNQSNLYGFIYCDGSNPFNRTQYDKIKITSREDYTGYRDLVEENSNEFQLITKLIKEGKNYIEYSGGGVTDPS